MKRVALLVAVCLVGYLGTGVYVVQPDEEALVCRFGAILSELRPPGLHLGLPWGLDRVFRIKAREVKRVTIGPVRVGSEAVGTQPRQFMTGDRNLINVRATVQFTIQDPAQYLFHATAVEPLVAKAGEAALAQVLAGVPVDHALTRGKQELGIFVGEQLQQRLNRYELGVTIRSVDIGAVEPPAEVAEAFDNVVSALRQRDQQINEAHSFANQTREQATADAQRTRDDARGYQERMIRRAQGESQRFERLLAEYERAPELTAQRLYMEMMAETLPRFRAKLIIDPDNPLDLSILREDSR